MLRHFVKANAVIGLCTFGLDKCACYYGLRKCQNLSFIERISKANPKIR